MFLNEPKLGLSNCSSQDTTIALWWHSYWSVFCSLFFTQHGITCIWSRVPLHCIVIDQIHKLTEDGLNSLPEMSRYIENTWISRKNQNRFVLFLHMFLLHLRQWNKSSTCLTFRKSMAVTFLNDDAKVNTARRISTKIILEQGSLPTFWCN